MEAFAKAGRSPSQVDFVELHATGYDLYSWVALRAETGARYGGRGPH